MLLWRGQSQWYYGSASQRLAIPLLGTSDTLPVRAEITRGTTTVRFAIYGSVKVLLFDSMEVSLDGANALLLDIVEGSDSATVVGKVSIDATFKGAADDTGRRLALLSQAEQIPALKTFLEP